MLKSIVYSSLAITLCASSACSDEDPNQAPLFDAGNDAAVVIGEPDGSMLPMDASTGLPEDASSGDDEPAEDASLDAGEPVDAGALPDAEADAAPPPKRIEVHTLNVLGERVNEQWVAVQDGDGPWSVLGAPTEAGTYAFEVHGDRFGIAVACERASPAFSELTLHYAASNLSAPLEIKANGPCYQIANQAISSLKGSYVGAPGTDTRNVGFVYGWNSGIPAGNYTMFGLRAGETYDVLVAASQGLNLKKLLIVRDLAAQGVDITRNVDLSMEGNVVEASLADVTIENAPTGSGYNGQVVLSTRGELESTNLALATQFSSSNDKLTGKHFKIPAGQWRASDRYLVIASDRHTTNRQRVLKLLAPQAGASMRFPDHFNATFTARTNPYFQPSVSFADYPETTAYRFKLEYSANGAFRRAVIEVDPRWLEIEATLELEFPDFSGLSGFQTAWLPPASPAASSVSLTHTALVEKDIPSGALHAEISSLAALPSP